MLPIAYIVFLRIFWFLRCEARHLAMAARMLCCWKPSNAVLLCLARLPTKWSVFYWSSSELLLRARAHISMTPEDMICWMYSGLILARWEHMIML